MHLEFHNFTVRMNPLRSPPERMRVVIEYPRAADYEGRLRELIADFIRLDGGRAVPEQQGQPDSMPVLAEEKALTGFPSGGG
jgi:hypothetical protein